MARTNSQVRKNIDERRLTNTKKNPKPKARSNPQATVKPKPKTKTEEREKLAAKRAAARENAPKPSVIRKERLEEGYAERKAIEQEMLPADELVIEEPIDPAIAQYDQTLLSATLPDFATVLAHCLEAFESDLMSKDVYVSDSFGTKRELTEAALERMFYDEDIQPSSFLPTRNWLLPYIEQCVISANPQLELASLRYPSTGKRRGKKASTELAETWLTRPNERTLKHRMVREIPFRRWLSFVAENPDYRFARPYAEAMTAVEEHGGRSYTSPEDRRYFVLDIGPTNSGKTYSGIQRLASASSGVYLGPLRLLAMEVADTLNAQGTPCSLLTGEEAHHIPGAEHVASTVEMLDRSARYEVAVIDECQMISDPERGYAWAGAIASVNASIIHLCLAPEAETLVIGMLDGLGEEYEVHHHERLVPLEAVAAVKYPKDIRTGDALIAFSRKSVQTYAADLESRGIKTSIVYGALPYDVRKEEVRKFMDGETQVVVATDAIGMGLNLPVQRIVFAEMEKFDGKEKRELHADEIKQIAGRAGRYGKYEVGYATAVGVKGAALVSDALTAETPQIDEIRLDIPRAVLDSPYPLSMLMRAWEMDAIEFPYVKRDLSEQISLARRVEELPNDFVYDAVEIPFRSGEKYIPLDDIWEAAVRRAHAGKEFELTLYPLEPGARLQYYEDAAKVADLAYGLAKRYGTPRDMVVIDRERKLISQMMIEKLKESPEMRVCTWCGLPMPPDSQHGMHDVCHREYRRERRWGLDGTGRFETRSRIAAGIQ